MSDVSLYIVAGEASGDLLGSRLMEALKSTHHEFQFSGIGGPKMQAQGLKSLFPYSELSLLGIIEVIRHIPRIFKRIHDTFEDIRLKQPSAVITIDAPGFTFRLAERLAKHPETRHIKRIHYVAPTVWAYKPQRVHWVKRIFNHLMVILPFEPPYFDAVEMPCSFVGHQIAWEWKQKGSAQAFLERHSLPADAPVLCLLPGSRMGELKRLMPIFEQTVTLLKSRITNITPCIIAAQSIESTIHEMCSKWRFSPLIIPEKEKKDAFAAAQFALAKSGTVALELPLAGVPTVVTYKVSRYSAWALRRMTKLKFVNLINILLNEEIIPEMIQEKCSPELLAVELLKLFESKSVQETQIRRAAEARDMLGINETHSPSERAAAVVLKEIGLA